MKHHIPRKSGKAISQKIKIISTSLAQHNPITLWEAWYITKDYWRDNYGKELTYELVEEEYRKRVIMNIGGTRYLSTNLAREELEKLENKNGN